MAEAPVVEAFTHFFLHGFQAKEELTFTQCLCIRFGALFLTLPAEPVVLPGASG